MYTQCPDCSVAFRVTADVLKQAAGKVRCGGCGNAFNALAHLSEEKPVSAPAQTGTAANSPDLTPEPPAADDPGTKPKSISAEQSAALLKTLDQLAGEDIRIEDTGVEWRVLSADEAADDSGPHVIDTRQESIIEQLESIADRTPAEEMRFDDNTPLPEDFGDDGDAAPPPPAAEVEAAPEPQPHPADTQVDLIFGDPDEWEDLLGEVGEPAPAGADIGAAESDATVLADAEADASAAADIPLDMDTQFELQAEAMGVDISGIRTVAADSTDDAQNGDAVDTGDTSIEEDLIAAAFEAEAEARKEVSAAEEMLEDLADVAAEAKIDIEAQLAELEAYAPGDSSDDAGDAALDPEPGTETDDDSDDTGIEVEEFEAEPDNEVEESGIRVEEFQAEPDDDGADTGPETATDDAEPEITELEFEEPETLDDEAELIDSLHVEQELAIEAELKAAEVKPKAGADIGNEPEAEAESEVEADSGPGEIDTPEMSEEEMTINRMIDQDLLAIAVEDDDGFTSTIVQKQPGSDDAGPGENRGNGEAADDVELGDEDDTRESILAAAAEGGMVETIIMEGESIRGAIDAESEAKKVSFMEEAKSNIAKLRSSDDGDRKPTNVRMIAGIAVLALLLIGQYIHQQRESLATIPAFNNSIGSIYRGIGQPVTPKWNVGGWRFEATKGDIGDGEDVLTIYSRVGNVADTALPYPLIHVALTDRFEEIIGSRVLEPAEYLAGNPDPRRPVAPGESFDAAMAIETPAPEATGFRLDVCYRRSGGLLRCAIEDFK